MGLCSIFPPMFGGVFKGGCGAGGVCESPGFFGGIGGGFPLSTLETEVDFNAKDE